MWVACRLLGIAASRLELARPATPVWGGIRVLGWAFGVGLRAGLRAGSGGTFGVTPLILVGAPSKISGHTFAD